MVEHTAENRGVASSILALGTATFEREWLRGRASPCQGEGRGFKSRLPLHFTHTSTRSLLPRRSGGMVDATVSKTVGRKSMSVRLRPSALLSNGLPSTPVVASPSTEGRGDLAVGRPVPCRDVLQTPILLASPPPGRILLKGALYSLYGCSRTRSGRPGAVLRGGRSQPCRPLSFPRR